MQTRSHWCETFSCRESGSEKNPVVVLRRHPGSGAVDARLSSLKRLSAVRRKHGRCRVLAARLQGRVARHRRRLCRAVAAAVFGDANKVRYTPLTTQQRFTALQSGEVDLLARNTTWTLSRDTSLGLNFVGVNYYDGQGFMVPKKANIRSAKQLSG